MKLLSRQLTLSAMWILLVMLWSVARICAVSVWLSEYGISTKIFAAVEISSSLIYGASSAKAVLNHVSKQRRSYLIWGLIACVSYIAPDAFVFVNSRSMPTIYYVVIVLLAVSFGAYAVFTIARAVRSR
ncbi:MAG: hypothetical protein EBT42_06095 [Actinobacteria bacterium]|jgi:hypothetical protein|nr:hypothetical protein [Actinomycetota bacterium]